MDQNRTRFAPEAATDEPASPCNTDAAGACAVPNVTAEAPPDARRRPADRRFATEAEEKAYWAGIRIGRRAAAAALKKERRDSHFPPPGDSHFSPPPHEDPAPPREKVTVPSDPLDRISDAAEAAFPPGSRKPRHDGFTPERIGAFLRDLAAHGIVEHAAEAARVSASAAYAFRNRRQGRAFGQVWDAILINRSRARLAAENQAVATLGTVSRRYDGEGNLTGEYHYRDNRLAMAMLTRLDKLAEAKAPELEHLRALSEDLDDFIDCVAGGGDADAFVAARRPAAPEPEPAATARAPLPPDEDPDLTLFAKVAGFRHYRDVNPLDIPVEDLDPTREAEWMPDQRVRAWRSGFMIWLHLMEEVEKLPRSPGAPLCFHYARAAAALAAGRDLDELPEAGGPVAAADRAREEDFGEDADDADAPEIEVGDLDPNEIATWSDDQLARAWAGGILLDLPSDFWDHLAATRAAGEAPSWHVSTSSTYPAAHGADGG